MAKPVFHSRETGPRLNEINIFQFFVFLLIENLFLLLIYSFFFFKYKFVKLSELGSRTKINRIKDLTSIDVDTPFFLMSYKLGNSDKFFRNFFKRCEMFESFKVFKQMAESLKPEWVETSIHTHTHTYTCNIKSTIIKDGIQY